MVTISNDQVLLDGRCVKKLLRDLITTAIRPACCGFAVEESAGHNEKTHRTQYLGNIAVDMQANPDMLCRVLMGCTDVSGKLVSCDKYVKQAHCVGLSEEPQHYLSVERTQAFIPPCWSRLHMNT